MSTHTKATETIMRAWKLAWSLGTQADLPVEIENRKFTRPVESPWGRLTLQRGKTTPVAVGARLERTPFVLFLQVFIPEGQGTRIAEAAADSLSKLNLGKFAEAGLTVNFDTASLEPAAVVAGSGHAQFSVTIDGHYDLYD